MTQLVGILYAYITEITLTVLLLLLLFAGILLQKISAVQKRLAKVTGQVEDYLKVVLEEASDGMQTDETGKEPAQQEALVSQSAKHGDPEAQNQLISAVLKEIFP